MATYVNDLRLKEITTGDESGTWGTSTNTNLELIANAMGLGAEAIPNASTHTITMADGAADEFRSTFLRLTGGGQACTVTLGPSTLSHTWIMRNETAAALTLTQGSGANVVIAAGQTKIVSTDGGGSGAIVYEMDDLELAGNLIASAATITTLASSAATLTGGTVNGMVVGGSTPAAGTFTTLTANTSATVSGDLTVDTSTLKVDSTNNRVGILNASPDVVLDIGSSTDAVHMPVGTTGQRPTGAAGYFRYNSTLSQFEGYTDGWGAIGGGGGSNLVSNTMTGDGSTTTISLTNNPQNENNTQVYIDGVYQNKDTYSVSGTTLTFSTAPPLGTAVEVMTIEPTAINIPADGSVTPAKIASGDFYFDTNTLYVDATNNRVGIGITPATLLDIKEGTAATDAIIGLTAGTGGRAQIRSEAQADNTSSELSFYTMSGSNTSEAMRISGSNVGIGTSSPTTKGHFYSSTAMNQLSVDGTGAIETGINFKNGGTTYGQIYFNNVSPYDMSVLQQYSTGSLIFGTNDTERMRIDSSGRVGIGTSSPTQELEIKAASVPTLKLNQAGTYGAEIALRGNDLDIAGSANAIVFYTGGNNDVSTTERMRIDGATGNVGIGGVGNISPSGTRFVIYGTGSSGAGIYFGSNVLLPTNNVGGLSDDVVDLGQSNYRYDNIYATSGAVNTSDRNEKQDIETLSDAEQRVAVACKNLLRKFRWKSAVAEKGDNARIHFGIIAQDLQDAFTAEGLDAERYAMWCSDTWWETQTEVAAVEATEDTEAVDAYTRTDTYDTAEEAPEGATERTRLGVRYSELLAFIISAI